MTRTKLSSLVALALGFGSVAYADTKPNPVCDDAAKAKEPATFHYEMIDGKKTMVVTSNIIICGHPARPSVVYVVTPKTVDYAWESLEQHFVPRILDSVKRAPFGGDGSR